MVHKIKSNNLMVHNIDFIKIHQGSQSFPNQNQNSAQSYQQSQPLYGAQNQNQQSYSSQFIPNQS